MKIIVHRGTKQIGGSCIEVQSGSDRILLDLRMPLPSSDGNDADSSRLSIEMLLECGILPPIDGVYANDVPSVRAVVVSHVHQDHIGLAQYVHPSIPVYATEGTWALQDALKIFLPEVAFRNGRAVLPKQTAVKFGSLAVTAIPVDHSAPDAVAILVQGDGKQLLYSGDLRAHGRKFYLFDLLASRLSRSIDVLLLEGTTVGRPDADYSTEQSLEPEFVRLFKRQKHISLVFCSAQNLDRLVTIYRSVKRTRKIMVIDLYTAYTLHQLQCVSHNIPQWDWQEVRVVPWKYQQDRLANAGKADFSDLTKPRWIGWKEMKEKKRDIVLMMRSNRKIADIERAFSEEVRDIQVIWSMWNGYWPTDQYVRPFCEKHAIECHWLHTSGHASLQDLRRLANALAPRIIIPIHTERPEEIARNLENTRLLSDGQSYEV